MAKLRTKDLYNMRNEYEPSIRWGDDWFVDSAVSGTSGKSQSEAFATITEALAVAQDYDTIWVAAGDYDEGAALAITQTGLKIIGQSNSNQMLTMLYSSSASHHLMTINAHNVEISNMGFYQTKDTYSAIMCSTTASFFKIWIHDCRFTSSAGEYGVHFGTTYDSPDCLLENCKFDAWQTAAIYCYCTRGCVRHNDVITVAAKIGIHLPATGSNRGGLMCYKNNVLGVNSTDTGISVGAVNAGMLFLSGNLVCGCGTANISQFANGQYCGTENYASSTAPGAIIDIDN